MVGISECEFGSYRRQGPNLILKLKYRVQKSFSEIDRGLAEYEAFSMTISFLSSKVALSI